MAWIGSCGLKHMSCGSPQSAGEKQIKEWRRAWKIQLIESDNPQWADLFYTLQA